MEKNNYQNQTEHPGKILAVMLKKVNMNQKELAIRTGMTEKHISTVINGSRDISLDFSKKLEYVFNDVENGYFYDLQLKYDELKQKQEEENGITENEKSIYMSAGRHHGNVAGFLRRSGKHIRFRRTGKRRIF